MSPAGHPVPVGSSPHDTVLVSTQWLEEHLNAPDVCIIDIRGKILPPGSKPRYLPKREEYEAAHIPGAVFVDWTRDIVDVSDPVPVQIATAEDFSAKMRELGVGDATLVVAYDDYDHVLAGRMAWALRYYGHDAVRVLDGGWQRWAAEGRGTVAGSVAGSTRRAAGHFTARVRPSLRRSADDVERALGRSDTLLIDARSAEQYAGSVVVAGRGGHIPGARNVPYPSLIDPATGQFLPRDELARVLAASGVDVARLPRDVVVYCNGGVSCTVVLNALRMLGKDDVAVYDGSWNEWGPDPRRPANTGREP